MFNAVADERMARELAEERQAEQRRTQQFEAGKKVSLDDLFAQIQEGELKDFNIIVKADVQGSRRGRQEPRSKSSPTTKCACASSTPASARSTSRDVMLACDVATPSSSASTSVRTTPRATAPSARSVDMRMYRVIYDCIDEVEAAMKGMLAPKFNEVVIGHAEVRQTFSVSKRRHRSRGCYVQDGKITAQRAASASSATTSSFIEGELASLRRFKDDVKEVAAGYECGMQVEKFNDIKEGDVIECFVNEQL